MNFKIKSSLLKPQIGKFYEETTDESFESVNKYLCDNNSFNFADILELLLEHQSGQSSKANAIDEFTTYSYEDYLRCYRKLLPIFARSLIVVAGENGDLPLELRLQWLGTNANHLKVSPSDLKTVQSTQTIELVLLLTSMLENALGNVYFSCTQGRSPPHLLRDLLDTRELKEVFGIEAIIFLKILLGTPNSINLRNIVWHGFPQPDEIPAYYVAVLLLTIHSLGCELQAQEFDLQLRPQIKDFTQFLNPLEDQFKIATFSLDNVEQQRELLSSCNWISEEHKIFWKQLFYYYQNHNYWNFVILILPQIELLLRLIYGCANNYDISAKLDEYYITMDTIFESEVPANAAHDKHPNKLLSCESQLSEGALKCMYDLFVAPNGPRLRDKISHGEVHMTAINNAPLCRFLLHLSLHLLTANERKFPLANYESKFHLNCWTKQTISSAKAKLHDLAKLHVKEKLEFKNINYDAESNSINIFQRPRKEPELVLLVLKISEMIAQTCSNYEESIKTRLALLERRVLHSKRRRTLEKLLAALPQTCVILNEILQCMNTTFRKLQNYSDAIFSEAKNFDKLLRFLKHTLKICEHFVKYSDKDSNEWIKVLELCSNFTQIRVKYFEP